MQKQSGNVLIFILIAIFLLGGLTAMLARSGNNTEEAGSTEKDNIAASEVLNYLASMKSGIEGLLQRGCSENEISFWYDNNLDGLEDASDMYYNASSPTDRSCHVFRVEGAGISRKNFTNIINAAVTAEGWDHIAITAQDNVTSLGKLSSTELLFLITHVKKSICEQINKIASVPMNGTAFYLENFYMDIKFTGSYTAGSADSTIGNESAVYADKKIACIQNGGAIPILYYALIVR